MIRKETLSFLAALKKNNDRAWMEKNRQRYLDAKDDFHQFVDSLLKNMSDWDKDLAGLDAKNCTFRINRDIRFSKNKDPYKTNLAAFMNKGGKKINNAGYYLHLEPGACFLAGGLYMPEPERLAQIRQEIDYNLKEWKSVIGSAAFKKCFPQGPDQEMILSRPPRGYEADNPAIEYLKLKSFTFSFPVNDEVFTKNGAEKEVIRVFKLLKPVILFLNRASD